MEECRSVTPQVKTIEELTEICKRMQTLGRDECFEYGASVGITHHNVDSIRQMLGLSERQNYHRLQKDERERIVWEYEHECENVHELARRHNVSYNAVFCLLKHRHIATYNPRSWTKIQTMRAIDCKRKGMNSREISQMVGKSMKSVQMKLKRLRREGRI